MNKSLLHIILIALLLFTPKAFAKDIKIQSYDLIDKGNFTVLELSLTAKPRYKAFIVSSPPRLVVDLNDTIWSAKTSLLNHDLVKNVRQAAKKDKTRIVLDLHKPVKIEKTFFDLKQKKLFVIFKDPLKKVNKNKKKSSKESAKKEHDYKSNFPVKLPTFSPIKLPSYDQAKKEKIEKPSSKKKKQSSVKGLFNFMPLPPPSKPRYTAKSKKRDRKFLIVIDPGHGGRDPGAISRYGLKEKDVVLSYARYLKGILERTGRYRVILTRAGNYYINLYDRVKKAQKYNADLFISLHADSHPKKKTKGLSVYTLSEARAKREARKLSKKATKEKVITGVDLNRHSPEVRDILIDMTQRQTKNESAVFAEMLVREMKLKRGISVLGKTHRFAGFAVLTGANVPSVLVELGYLSNDQEARLLATSSYKKKLTNEIKDAIDKFFIWKEQVEDE